MAKRAKRKAARDAAEQTLLQRQEGEGDEKDLQAGGGGGAGGGEDGT